MSTAAYYAQADEVWQVYLVIFLRFYVYIKVTVSVA